MMLMYLTVVKCRLNMNIFVGYLYDLDVHQSRKISVDLNILFAHLNVIIFIQYNLDKFHSFDRHDSTNFNSLHCITSTKLWPKTA